MQVPCGATSFARSGELADFEEGNDSSLAINRNSRGLTLVIDRLSCPGHR